MKTCNLKPPVANLNDHLMKVHMVTSVKMRMAILAEVCLNACSGHTLKSVRPKKKKKKNKDSLPSQSILREQITNIYIYIYIYICYLVCLVPYLFIYFVMFCSVLSYHVLSYHVLNPKSCPYCINIMDMVL